MLKKPKIIAGIVFILVPFIVMAQCSITLDEATHINCYGDNTGAITVNVTSSPVATIYSWTGPFGFSSPLKDISNLLAGDYQLTVNDPTIPCTSIFNHTVQQSPQITANFTLSGLCEIGDSADVNTITYGGTPPYTYLWSTGVTTASTTNLAPGAHNLKINDKNDCVNWEFLTVATPSPIQVFMSISQAECKDDNTGSVKAFVTGGTSPYHFFWEEGLEEYDNNVSALSELIEGLYAVEIIDNMGCVINDTAIVKHDPKVCLEVYSVFSPNEDAIHDFWEIQNIDYYPEALVEVYSRTGDRVFRSREYKNTLKDGFTGKINGKRLPSATYYYIIDLENGDDPITGTVTIIR